MVCRHYYSYPNNVLAQLRMISFARRIKAAKVDNRVDRISSSTHATANSQWTSIKVDDQRWIVTDECTAREVARHIIISSSIACQADAIQ